MSDREKELNERKVCRFCLSQQSEKLDGIFSRDVRFKSTAPLPVQVMSIASIEVFSNDGLPSWICVECRLHFEHSYRFKQMCKRAETLLKQYPLTGVWPNALAKPKIPLALLPKHQPVTSTSISMSSSPPMVIPVESDSLSLSDDVPSSMNTEQLNRKKQTKVATAVTSVAINASGPKKLLNATPVAMPEPPVPKRLKREQPKDESEIFLLKAENDEELTLEDVQRLIASAEHNGDMDDTKLSSSTGMNTSGEATIYTDGSVVAKKRPRLLNKASMRILNKDAEVIFEPRLSTPLVKRDEDGNVAIVTAILGPNEPYANDDPIKNVAPVETNIFPCPHCDRSFPLRQLRDIHAMNHSRQRSFHCNACNKSFFSKYDLQKHNLVHTGDKPYKCTICNKGFTRTTLLYRHEKCHTDIPKNICVYCEKPFISKEELEKHTARHLKKRPFQCKQCNKAFAFKQGLERHEVVHSRDLPYPCQYCDQGFLTPSKLARHLTAHAGKRPYPCKLCNKSYLLTHHLTRHMRAHEQSERSYTCAECNAVFNTRPEIIAHASMHIVKTLCCPLCKESFDDVKTATLHVKSHGHGDSFACEFCDLIFLTSSRLVAHNEAEHSEFLAAYRDNLTMEIEGPTRARPPASAPLTMTSQPKKMIIQTMEELESTINEILEEDMNINKTTVVKKESLSPVAIPRKIENSPNSLEILSEEIIRPKSTQKSGVVKNGGNREVKQQFVKATGSRPRGRPPGSGSLLKMAKGVVKGNEKLPMADSHTSNPEISTALKKLSKSVSIRKMASPKPLEPEPLPISKKTINVSKAHPERPQRTSTRRSNEIAASSKSTVETEDDLVAESDDSDNEINVEKDSRTQRKTKLNRSGESTRSDQRDSRTRLRENHDVLMQKK